MTPHPTQTPDRSPLNTDSQETSTSTSRAGHTDAASTGDEGGDLG